MTLHALERGERRLLTSTTTNSDGRTTEPLLSADAIPVGQYELTFFVGDYWRGRGEALASPAFLDDVVIRVGVADAAGRYHVPLLVSPYGYSTYRGS